MRRRLKKRAKKIGLPPGTLVYTGEGHRRKTEITLFRYNADTFEERSTENLQGLLDQGERVVTWIDIENLHRPEMLEEIGRAFSIHPLILEDILNVDQRPKAEDCGSHIFFVLKMLTYSESKQEIESEQISFVLTERFLFTFQEGVQGDAFGAVRDRLRKNNSRLRKGGADLLANELLDAIVDQYFVILERLGEQIERLEERIVEESRPELLTELYKLKREALLLRRSTWPLRELTNALVRMESPLISNETRVYLRDIYDHTIQVIDTVETYRDILAGLLDLYLSSVSNRLNKIMKVLTIYSALFMPLTFLAGIYGMNFEYMPELKMRYGYPVVLLAMLIIAVCMIIYFKKKDWL